MCGPKQHYDYRTITIHPAIRMYSSTAFDSVETVKTITRKFIIEAEGEH